MTIVEFLEARIAEDEQTALAAAGQDHEGSSLRVRIVGNEGMFVFGPHEIAPSGKFGFSEDARTKHFESHDPARVLREVAAKRKIIAEHLGTKGYVYTDDGTPACETCGDSTELWPCRSILALAAVYSDHPEYQEDWAP